MKNIVVFLQNRDFFGAQITHIPLLKELKAKDPSARLHIFSKHKISGILKSLEIVDAVYYERSKLETFKHYLSLKPTLTVNLRKKSLLENCYIGLFNHGQKIGFETAISKRFFTDVQKHNPSCYRANNYLHLLGSTLTETSLPEQKRIVIIAGAGGDFKIWDIENYIELADRLKKRYHDYEVAFVLGEKEFVLKERIAQSVHSLYYNEDIKSLYQIIQTSAFVIANDCGPSHIAQITSKRYLILYSDAKEDAKVVIKEWFYKHAKSAYMIGEKGKHINTILVEQVYTEAIRLMEIT